VGDVRGLLLVHQDFALQNFSSTKIPCFKIGFGARSHVSIPHTSRDGTWFCGKAMNAFDSGDGDDSTAERP